MIVIISACLRVAVVCMVGLFAVRDKVPGSVSNVPAPPPPPAPITDAIRYARGEIWWYQNGDDLAVIDQRIDECRSVSANSTHISSKLGCFIQRQKLGLKRLAVAAGKSFVGFFVDGYVGQRDALTGPNPILATLKIMVFVGSLVWGAVTLFRKRVVIADYCQNRFGALHDRIFPPSPAAPPAPKEFQIYFSGATGQAVADEKDGARGGTAAATTDPEPTVMMACAEQGSAPLQRDVGSDEPGDGPCAGFVGGNPAPSPRILTQQWNAARSNAGRPLDDELPTNDTNAAEPIFLDLGPLHDRIEQQQAPVLCRRSSSPEHVHAEPADSMTFSAPPMSQSFASKKRVAFKEEPIDRPAAPTRSLPTGLPRRSPNVSPNRTVYDMSGRPTTLGQRAGPRLAAGSRVRPSSATEGAGRRPSY